MAPNRGKGPKGKADGSAETLRFAVGDSSLGSILVAAGANGVAAVLLGDGPGRLVEDLARRFPGATLAPGGRDVEDLVKRVVGFVEEPVGGLDFPLDLRGTAFQQKVWRAVRKIPAGRTSSYTEVAREVGSPRAMRAVGSACAVNTLALVVPCHRVLRSDGSLSWGEEWGKDRQRVLLAREAAAALGGRPTPAVRGR